MTSPPELAAAGPGINSSNGELPRPRAAAAKASLAAQLRARRVLPASSWRLQSAGAQSATLAVQVNGSPTPFGSLSAPTFAARRLLNASTVHRANGTGANLAAKPATTCWAKRAAPVVVPYSLVSAT